MQHTVYVRICAACKYRATTTITTYYKVSSPRRIHMSLRQPRDIVARPHICRINRERIKMSSALVGDNV